MTLKSLWQNIKMTCALFVAGEVQCSLADYFGQKGNFTVVVNDVCL